MAQDTDRVFMGRYRLVRKLGRGGMGSVWLGEHVHLKSPIAVKLMDESIANNEVMRGRFLREARAAASLNSQHVVRILDHGVEGETPFIAMELLEGESLEARLGRLGTLSPEVTARIITHVARGVQAAHELGIVHRDLKPDNIYLVRNDDEELAKVLDFGIAKAPNLGSLASAATNTGAMLGTPYYMSPEQAGASKYMDHRSDVWAMGVIAYQCLLGKRPFDGESFGELVLAICSRPLPIPSRAGPVPAGFDAWFARTCARDLEDRFDSAKQCAAALRRVCGQPESSGSDEFGPLVSPPRVQVRVDSADLLSTTGQVSAATHVAPTSSPRSRASWLLAGGLALTGGLAGSWWLTARSADGPEPPQEEVAGALSSASRVAAVSAGGLVDPGPMVQGEVASSVLPSATQPAVTPVVSASTEPSSANPTSPEATPSPLPKAAAKPAKRAAPPELPAPEPTPAPSSTVNLGI